MQWWGTHHQVGNCYLEIQGSVSISIDSICQTASVYWA